MAAQDTQRLFFALWPDDEVRVQLQRAARILEGARGRHVAVSNLHVTLAFLGDVNAETRPSVEAAAAKISGQAFTLVLDHLGAFPRARVVWLGASQVPEALEHLAAALGSGLAACGLEPERRPYHPHLTLMRKAGRLRVPATLDTPVIWPVREFALVESRISSQGAEYHVLETWALQGEPAA